MRDPDACTPNQAALLAAGIVPDLIPILRSSRNLHVLEVGSALLAQFLRWEPSLPPELIAQGGLAALQKCLRRNNARVQTAALGEPDTVCMS